MEDVLNKVSLVDVHTHISINKEFAYQPVLLVHIQIQLLVYVNHVVQIVSHAYHQLSVFHVDQDLILVIIFVLLVHDVPIID